MKLINIFLFVFAFLGVIRAEVFTDFDTDSLENWRSEGDGYYFLETGTGNPGNCMRVDDDATGDLNIAIAPPKFLGDWSQALSTDTLSFDVFVHQINGSVLANAWGFRISGPGGSARGPLLTVQPGQWNRVSIAMDSTQWVLNSGTWKGILDYVNHMEVRAEYINGDEYVRIDNIGLSFTPVLKPILPKVASEFDNGSLEGWTFEESGGISLQGSDGNPGGYVRISDGTGLTRAIAPPKFLGDWSGLNGTAALRFDLKVTNFSGTFLISDYFLRLSGPGGLAIVPMDSSIQQAFNQWHSFSFLITDTVWTMIRGEWEALLENVTEIKLLAEYIDGSEIVWLDNFMISDDKPIAAFEAEPAYAFAGEDVQFHDRSRYVPWAWFWDFGDGSVSSDQSPAHAYDEPGLYDIKLVVSNEFGSDSLIREAFVQVAGYTDSILYEDDFDDDAIHPAWQFDQGSWVEQNGTIVQNSNYYSGGYLGGAYAIVGSPVWKNYRLSVDFRSTDDDKIGVVFNYQDKNNFYLFTWQKQGERRALKKFIDGVETDVHVDTVAYIQDDWYHLEIVTDKGHIRGMIDSLEIFNITDSTFLSGKAGLYCHGNQSSYWDNFKIVNLDYVTSIDDPVFSKVASDYRLYQNYPNPFNPKTTIRYRVGASQRMELSVYNLLGQKIATLVSGQKPTGLYSVEWDASDLPSGVYIYKLATDHGLVQSRKLLLLK